MPTVNEKILDAQIKHSVYIERYKSGVLKKIIGLLNRTETDLIEQIAGRLSTIVSRGYDLGPEQTKRLADLLKIIQDKRADVYGVLGQTLFDEMIDFTRYEADFQIRLADNAGVGVNLTMPSNVQLKAVVTAQPFQGRLLRDWAKGLEAADRQRIQDAVRIGIVEGQTTDQIVRRIRGTKSAGFQDGVLEISRRDAEGVVRTAVAHVQNRARMETFNANADIVQGVQYAAVLDSHTTVLCFTGSTVVQSVGVIHNVFRSKYRGEIVTVTTASGKKIEGTPNHPILTTDGFLPIGKLDPSKHIVYTVPSDVVNVLSRDDVSVPTEIRKLFDAVNKPSISSVEWKRPSTADFYGDGMGMYGKIDILTPNVKLRSCGVTSVGQQSKNKLFRFVHKAGFFSALRRISFLLGRRTPPIQSSPFNSTFPQNGPNHGFAAANHFGDYCGSDTAAIEFDNPLSVCDDVNITLSALKNWHDTCLFEQSGDSGCGGAVTPADFCSTDTGLVELDDVVAVEREFRDCHVYTLSNSLGFYMAGGLIVKNCASRDGKVFPLDKAPPIPAHFRCRSIYVPYFGDREGDRASKFGPVPAATTFEEFLRKQSDEFQAEVLGVERARQFRYGTPLTKFVDKSGHVYTLKELARRER